MYITRTPHPALRPFIRLLWASDRAASPAGARRELMLPTGLMHLAVNLAEEPLLIFPGPAQESEGTSGYALVGGARAGPYMRRIPSPARSVGALFNPGACQALFGAPADVLAGRHTRLDDLWGSAAGDWRARLQAAATPEARLAIFEAQLAARTPKLHGLHPAVAHALARFESSVPVREVVRETGYSHRRFIALFRQTVGLPPKVYCRLRRFQRVLRHLAATPAAAPAELALVTEHSDQAHFNREFMAFAKMTPGEYRRRRPTESHHVPISESE